MKDELHFAASTFLKQTNAKVRGRAVDDNMIFRVALCIVGVKRFIMLYM